MNLEEALQVLDQKIESLTIELQKSQEAKATLEQKIEEMLNL